MSYLSDPLSFFPLPTFLISPVFEKHISSSDFSNGLAVSRINKTVMVVSSMVAVNPRIPAKIDMAHHYILFVCVFACRQS